MSQGARTPGFEVAEATVARAPTEKLSYRIAVGWEFGR